MNALPSLPRIVVIDSNVYYSKKLGDALKQQGFEVVLCMQAAYALTMLEWNAPAAILCATNLREMGALEMAPLLRADPKTSAIPLIALGSGADQALLEAYRSGCDDYVDRRRAPADVAAHVRSFLLSRQNGFQPTQMLSTADTAFSGSLSHLDLPGVIQMLAQARQTGSLNINAGDIDGIIFFEAGEIVHAECGPLFGDEAVTQIVKSCCGAASGVYKFVYGATNGQRTVLRSATDLLLDAMREFDEDSREAEEKRGEIVMSDTSTLGTLTEARTPTVYFIDDSATMREVIKIAFRKEKFNVITCADAASAMAQFGEIAPDVIITDVIMPDKDGYEVCQFIKQHERFSHTPVILMSGVVNRTVAEKATAVSADELIRKPFQPHELILRVKGLLAPKSAGVPGDFPLAIPATLPMLEVQQAPLAPPHTLNSMFAPANAPAVSTPFGSSSTARPNLPASPGATGAAARATPESQKLRHEIRRLELLVKKLQAELEAERQYSAALESHLKSIQDSE